MVPSFPKMLHLETYEAPLTPPFPSFPQPIHQGLLALFLIYIQSVHLGSFHLKTWALRLLWKRKRAWERHLSYGYQLSQGRHSSTCIPLTRRVWLIRQMVSPRCKSYCQTDSLPAKPLPSNSFALWQGNSAPWKSASFSFDSCMDERYYHFSAAMSSGPISLTGSATCYLYYFE